jgi:NAD(P)-dependent dehydrogenase (short-subunit alcohol dehydrogenase family)
MSTKRYAIVTGAASGLGGAISVALARGGWHIALADLNDAGGQETLSLVRAAGGDGQVEHLDVTSVEQWRSLVGKLQAAWPGLDLLVNNAGVGVGGNVGQLSLDDWRWIMDINLWGGIYGCHTTVEWMKRNPRGAHIVNIASMAAIVCAPGMAPYNVTKAGMVALTETLYGELKSDNIGVTVVCPTFFQTNIITSGRFASRGQRKMADALMSHSRLTAEQVAAKIVRAVERKQVYVLAPAMARFFWRLKRLMPRTFLKIISRGYKRRLSTGDDA